MQRRDELRRDAGEVFFHLEYMPIIFLQTLYCNRKELKNNTGYHYHIYNAVYGHTKSRLGKVVYGPLSGHAHKYL